MATARYTPIVPATVLFLPSERLVPASSVLYKQIAKVQHEVHHKSYCFRSLQTSKPSFPYFMHPVMILSYEPSTQIVTFLPLVSLRERSLEAARQEASTSIWPRYILINQSWCAADLTSQQDDEDFAIFPQARLARYSLRIDSKFWIVIGKTWSIERTFLKAFPPRDAFNASHRKVLPNPRFYLSPESLEWVNTLNHMKMAFPAMRRKSTNSADSAIDLSSPTACTPETNRCELKFEQNRVSTLNASASVFVPGVKLEQEPEVEDDEQPGVHQEAQGAKWEQKLGVHQEERPRVDQKEVRAVTQKETQHNNGKGEADGEVEDEDDEWGDWSKVHSGWIPNSKSKKVQWKKVEW